MSDFDIVSIPDDEKLRWTVLIDGEEVKADLVVITSQFGTIKYGRRPEGYNGWALWEVGGGGAGSVPFARDEQGEIYVGVILEKRLNLGGEVLNYIGGYCDPGETHRETALRETLEETGVDLGEAAYELPGLPGAANRAYWVANAEEGEGIHTWTREVPFALLEPAEGVSYKPRLKLGEDDEELDLAEAWQALLPKNAAQVRFLPWREAAMQVPCMISRSEILKLIATLL